MAIMDLSTDLVFCFDIFAQFHTAVWELVHSKVNTNTSIPRDNAVLEDVVQWKTWYNG